MLGVPDLATSSADTTYLAQAAAAALALPDLQGQHRDALRARRAAVACAASLSTNEIAELLGMHPRAVQRLRVQAAEPELVTAVDLQLRLRTAIRPASFVAA
jgi:hypothetical protein